MQARATGPLAAAEDVPRYRIQVVCARTGVAASTLRAWEHRYGFPVPSRSGAGYRLYSERDVMAILRMSALCGAGVSPAEAASIVAAESLGEAAPASSQELIQRLIAATSALDEASFARVLATAFDKRAATSAYDEVISPAMAQIGELWVKSELSVAHEHFASGLVRERLVRELRENAPDAAAPSFLLACADEEQHDIGLLGFALHVAEWGLHPVVLGARVPPAALAASAEQLRPRCVGVSVVREIDQRRARTLLARYGAVLRGQQWMLGGPGAPPIMERARAASALVPSTIDEARRSVLAGSRRR